MPLLIHGFLIPSALLWTPDPNFQLFRKAAASATQIQWFLEKSQIVSEKDTSGFLSSGAS
jgi:hypothetical protein